MSYQPALFDDEGEWPSVHILVSLMPQYAHLLVGGKKRYEYRRGKFIDKPATAYVYATRPKSREDAGLPSAQIVAVVRLGIPRLGIDEAISAKEEELAGSEQMMREWLRGFSTASTHPIESVHVLDKPIELDELLREFPNFHPPQRYLVLNRNRPLFEFLKLRSGLNS